MAIQNTFHLNVDIKQKNYINEHTVTSNDQVTFILSITDDGSLFDLSNVTTFTLVSVRPDRQSIMTLGALENDEVTFKLGTNELALAGTVSAAIQMYDADGRVSSIPFTYRVLKDPVKDYVPSENEKTLIELVLGEGPGIIEAAEQITVEATEAEALRKTAESGRVEAETQRVSAESSRKSAETTRNTNETNRKKNETDRGNAETIRESNEDTRKMNETDRQSAENARISNENTRIEQENARQTNTQTAITNVNAARDEAIEQANYVKGVGDANKNVPLSPVASFAAIATTYPNPVLGSKVQTTDNGKIYRWDGTSWKYVEEMNSNILTDIQTKLSETNRLTTTLSQGVSVVEGKVDALADVEIEGRTLTSLGNSPLEPSKKYVIADKKTKVIADGNTINGVGKFTKTGVSERVKIIRVENFEGKVSGSNVDNPHVAKRNFSTSLLSPTSTWIEAVDSSSLYAYAHATKLDGNVFKQEVATNGNMAQQLFSFNLIEAVERNIGRIPKTTVADKVAWLKSNINKLTANWHGFGSSVGGNKCEFRAWRTNGNTWMYYASSAHVQGIVAKLTSLVTTVSDAIDDNGFMHYLAYAEPSNGTIPSVINTDYIELEIELKETADFTHPRVPLYEVSDTDYNKILVDWNADEVINRYPVVQGTQHLQGIGIIAEGDNLLPYPINENYNQGAGTSGHDNIWVDSKLEVRNGTSAYNGKGVILDVIPGQTYSLSFKSENGSDGIPARIIIPGYITNIASSPYTFTTTTNTIEIRFARNGSSNANAPAKFWDIMLTLGSTPKPFVPRNPSYLFADVKLGKIGNVADTLYKQDGRWMLRKSIEKEVVLDGSLAWTTTGDKVGYKAVEVTLLANMSPSSSVIMTKYDGNLIRKGITDSGADFVNITSKIYLTVSDADSGFPENHTPTANDWKRYFNGWKYTDGTTWTSVTGNGQTATAQQALDTMPTDYTPYKLSYVLANPQIIDLNDKVEGQLKVSGLTQINVDSGYRRTVVDGKPKWTKGSKFDYTVNPTNVKLTYAANLSSTVSDLVTKVEDNSKDISIHEYALDYIQAQTENTRMDLDKHKHGIGDITGLQTALAQALADAKTYTDTAISVGEPVSTTLVRGSQTVNVPKDSTVNVVSLAGKTVVNHTPLFDSGLWTKPATLTVLSPNKVSIVANGTTIVHQVRIPVKPNTAYTISGLVTPNSNPSAYFDVNAASGGILDTPNSQGSPVSFTTPSNVTEVYVRCVVSSNISSGTFTFENLILNEGTTAKEFVSNVKGITNPTITNTTTGDSLTLVGTFHDGDNVRVEDGQALVTRAKKEIVLNGNLPWILGSKGNGYKQVRLANGTLPKGSIDAAKVLTVKYNGKILKQWQSTESEDQCWLSSDGTGLYLTIPNVDSGWGPDYNPTPAEIQAYLAGWRMYTWDGSANVDYNGTGVKQWSKIYCGIGTSVAVGTGGVVVGNTAVTAIPAIMNDMGYTPYRLIYDLATPVTEAVKAIGSLKFVKGSNTVELSEGKIVRERVTPRFLPTGEGDFYYVNSNYFDSGAGFDLRPSKLSYSLLSFIQFYKNGLPDSSWVYEAVSSAYGNYQAKINKSNFDPTAIYEVHYIPLEPFKVSAYTNPITLNYRENIGGVVEELVSDITELTDRVNSIESVMGAMLVSIDLRLIKGGL